MAVTFCLLTLLGTFTLLGGGVTALNNGLARTPPMGWLSWERFRCQIDCVRHPLSCISEKLYTDMADRLVNDGYAELGYTLVNIDDCWPAFERDSKGKLVANQTRFPHGIKWLADYMHSKGLKLGIYEDYGTKTCGGYPGSLNHLKRDADTFAEWGVDMLKLDGCYSDVKTMPAGYPEMGKYLNESGRGMIYSCSWPAYEVGAKIKPNYTHIGEACNLWRNYDDIDASWESISAIINYYDHHQDELIPAQGPGKWNDPDMIVVGNPGVTLDQAKAQMAIWSMWSAPLLMSNDLRFLPPNHKAVLLNKNVVAINQDPHGIMGRLVANESFVGTYVKPVEPVLDSAFSYAVAFLNRHHTANQTTVSKLSSLGLKNEAGYFVEDLYTGEKHGLMKPSDSFQVTIQPTGVVLLKATVAGGWERLIPTLLQYSK